MGKVTELEHFVRKENVDADGKICAIARVIESKKNDICEYESCSSCNYYKDKNHILEVLLREYKEQIKLTEDERALLKIAFNLGYRWIARDFSYTYCYLYKEKPVKEDREWFINIDGGCQTVFKNMFKFVKWEDEEPYSIEELLNLLNEEE